MFWTRKKAILVGLFAALAVAVQLLLATPLVLIFGPVMGGPVMLFMAPLLLVLFWRILYAPWAIPALAAVVGVLLLPFPALGPPGFLPKVLILLLGGTLMEVAIRALAAKPRLASTTSGALGAATFIGLLWLSFAVLRVPGVEQFLSIAHIFILIAMVEGGLAGLAAEGIFARVRSQRLVISLRERR